MHKDKQDIQETSGNNNSWDIETIFKNLDETVAQMEKRETSLEESFRLYQEGIRLLRECSSRIDTVEKKMLQMNGDGTLSEF
ncbi:MAG: exodeoxyribonuclease VII small subunit [Eubacteriales bacterium]|nr:exodeoxyribonuclease VII small subunit [Eubacteriales bacterium]